MKSIKLTKGKVAIVDSRLYVALNKFKWYAQKSRYTFYAQRAVTIGKRQVKVSMHQMVFALKGLPVPKSIDHKDGDGLNNRFCNLRAATGTQQSLNRRRARNNTSGYIGVSFNRYSRRWIVQVGTQGKRVKLGQFDDPFSAAWVRDEFVQSLDPLAKLNNLIDRRIKVRRRKCQKVSIERRSGIERRLGRVQIRRRSKNNSSGYVDVTWKANREKWCASVSINGSELHVGYFDSSLKAAIARDKFIKLRGLNSTLNNVRSPS